MLPCRYNYVLNHEYRNWIQPVPTFYNYYGVLICDEAEAILLSIPLTGRQSSGIRNLKAQEAQLKYTIERMQYSNLFYSNS